MNRKEIFDAWAPATAPWSPWAKPVLFAHIPNEMRESAAGHSAPLPRFDVDWAVRGKVGTAIVADLPGPSGVSLALSLAGVGYRPVPLYNGVPCPPGDVALVDAGAIIDALESAAAPLAAMRLSAAAPPVFLLDSHRRVSAVRERPGVFDNRSVSLPSDFPSARHLRAHGIQRAVLVMETHVRPQADLGHTLRAWQDAGIEILLKFADDSASPATLRVKRPFFLGLLWLRLVAAMGMPRTSRGGFGGFIREPSGG